jgi:hypothetical protein
LGYSKTEITQAVERLAKQQLLTIVKGDPLDLLQLHLHGEQLKTSFNPTGENTTVTRTSKSSKAARKILNFKSVDDDSTDISFEAQSAADGLELGLAGRISPPTWQRLLHAFCRYQEPEEGVEEAHRHAAQQLVANHPVDQILLMIHHFQRRLSSLVILAHHWDEYSEMFEQETQEINLVEAREKHGKLDEKLRKHIQNWLAMAGEAKLTSEEVEVLEMMLAHRFPRRQLFWAYQARSRYLNLSAFFEENSSLMLAISSSGTLVKRP